MDEAPGRRRWDTDERGRGVADAAAFASAIDELASFARTRDWIAEDPRSHLLPHIERAVALRPGLRLLAARPEADGILAIDIGEEEGRATPAAPLRRRRRIIAHELIASVAETLTFVRESRDGDVMVFEVVTGEPGSDRFAAHGHTLRLRIRSVRGD